MPASSIWSAFSSRVHQVRAQFLFEFWQQFARIFILLVNCQAHAQAKFGVVFKQRVRPGGSASLRIHSPRGGGQVAAIDGGTTCCIRDDRAVTEELRDQFHVRCLTASRAGAAELKQRAQQLRILDRGRIDQFSVQIGDFHEEIPVLCFRSRRAGCGAMLSALRPTWVLSLAGQTSTHKVQPVQSSGATCTV